MNASSSTDAKLLIAPGCAHCPAMMQHLATLLKENAIGRLEIINIQQHPEIAQQLNVRSVPWLLLGEFTLHGAHSLAELREYLQLANSKDGIGKYIEQQLSDGKLTSLLDEIKQHPHWLSAVIELLENDDTSMQVRLGIDSLIESLSGSDVLREHVMELGQLSQHVDVSRLADIIHYLGLTRSEEAVAFIEPHCEHDNPDVRETCHDALAEIKAGKS